MRLTTPPMKSPVLGALALGLALGLLAGSGCSTQERYGKTHVQDLLKQFETPGLIGALKTQHDPIATTELGSQRRFPWSTLDRDPDSLAGSPTRGCCRAHIEVGPAGLKPALGA